jgi:glycerophosphoryl diester phosphodiesterase
VTWIPLSGVLAVSLGLVALGLTFAQPGLFVIAHRGASGHRPEHTLEAYRLAIQMGADAIEPDLVMTKDGVLIARHENEIGGTTDAAERFPGRRTTKAIDGAQVTGWFTEDFTLAEIRTLRARERLRFRSHAFDGRFGVPTFDEVLDVAEAARRETGRAIAVYPETKHPTYFRRLGLPLEEALLARLEARDLVARDSPVLIQSFERPSLEYLRPRTRVRLVQLLPASAAVTRDRLVAIAGYADGVGLEKTLIVPEAADRRVLPPTTVVADAHAAGLFVHAWTMRSDPVYLSPSYNGDPQAEVRQFMSLGVDGVFSDFPDVAVAARQAR